MSVNRHYVQSGCMADNHDKHQTRRGNSVTSVWGFS